MRVRVRSWHGVASWLWVANDENCGICRMAFNGCCPDCAVRDGCGPPAAELPGAAWSPQRSPVQGRRDRVLGPRGVCGCLSRGGGSVVTIKDSQAVSKQKLRSAQGRLETGTSYASFQHQNELPAAPRSSSSS
ncbi:anaphase-promoting complex subunit 11 isoform 1-T1 [Chlamydotis macqueenii]